MFLWFCEHSSVRIVSGNKPLILPGADLLGGGHA